ncbi:putative S-adenosyl-L-methionine-dependent protein-lysine N- methyltransferase that mono- and dimethylates elongation factor 1- alpha at 'Lys-316' [Lyophyllum shimeji]|uniref:Protein-lysine N-methyltransferase EFM4 n=1 Tax=Lyophyllum shimeji TaxID=47721 RepID=A0A9P3PQT8_LYOSH|nr:putative S-adenosyl-L-methionine-dependent protein-lysine N- methyltransferase that mono- and dimethylates elongation factor 1- alpha at 'Lys-316' [Lyophyllum shimeji]
MADSLQPSKLGTKEHWDSVYEEELNNFEEIGHEGEIWFGEETVERMVDWAVDNIPPASNPSMVEIGSGNGTLLLALAEAGYPPSHLSGIDYSPGAVNLAQSIARKRNQDLTFNTSDFLQDDPPLLPHMQDQAEGVWDLVLDKGTLDAIALGAKDEYGRSPAARYPGRVNQILRPGGYFLITSCNFTEDELKAQFATSDTRLTYHSRIEHPTYEFGGRKGSVVSSVAFQKAEMPT